MNLIIETALVSFIVVPAIGACIMVVLLVATSYKEYKELYK